MEDKSFKVFPSEESIYDRYAMEAMNSIIIASKDVDPRPSLEGYARKSFEIAEAMLIERRKRFNYDPTKPLV